MATLIPKIDISEIKNDGERFVAKALVTQLPNNVEVFHSFNWVDTNQNGTIREGESDFFIIDPDNGVLFIEVKGGSLQTVDGGTSWERVYPDGTSERLHRNPFDQVRDSTHTLIDRINEQPAFRGAGPRFTFGYAVALPDCNFQGNLPPAITPEMILDAPKCENLLSPIQKLFERWRRVQHPTLTTPEVDAIHAALFPKYSLLPVIWRKIEDQEVRLQRLTDEQKNLLDFISGHTLASIRGVAGSGKTILGLAKAQEMARKGMRTLFLCYNRPLKEWIEQSIANESPENLVVDTYHGLVSDLTHKASVRYRPSDHGDDPLFWQETAPTALVDATDILGPDEKFDAVVVDEGQDFFELWWTSLEGIFREPDNKKCYYVFFDPKQNIYVEKPSIPDELGPPFDLKKNCRNTKLIAEHCAGLIDQEVETQHYAPTGDRPEIIQAADIETAFTQAAKKVRAWCMPGHGRLKLSQVAVLAPGNRISDWPYNFGTIKATRYFDQWRNNHGVLLASWARFKGLEADGIIIIDAHSPQVAENINAHRYVARSRAKHLLVVIEVD